MENVKYIDFAENESGWLEARKKLITSTDVGVLMGFNSYGKTLFQLWHEKKNGLDMSIEVNDNMLAGQLFEAGIAQFYAVKNDCEVKPFKVFAQQSELKIGASFDYEIVSGEDKGALLEIKHVYPGNYAKNWENGEIPMHILMQVQFQLLLTGRSHAVLCAHIPNHFGSEIKTQKIYPHTKLHEAFLKKCAEFWEMPEPEPDFFQDAEIITKKLRFADEGVTLDLSDGSIDADAKRFLELKIIEKQAKEEMEAIKAKIFMIAQDAAQIKLSDGSISLKTVKATAGKVITQDMVGTVTGARAAWRRFDVKLG